MRITIKQLQSELKKANEQTQMYQDILEQIRLFIFPKSSAYANSFRDILPEILRLLGDKSFNIGATKSELETIYLLKEVIRWQINPETAMESKVQEGIRGFTS